MFSNLNKPAFGANIANASFGFSSATSSNPFGGQNQLSGKPSLVTAPAFGQTAGASLFPGSQQQSVGQFQSNTPSFGVPAARQTAFGTPTKSQPTFGGNVFRGTTQQAAGGSPFGGQQNKLAGFSFASPPAQPSLFGQPQPTAQQTHSPLQAATSVNSFGANAFGTKQQQGTVIKFQPVISTDTFQTNGVTKTFKTKLHCITCMKEYVGKSLEELRWEDYQANRKGPQQQGFGATPFSSVNSSVLGFRPLQDNKPVFGHSTSGYNSFGATPQASTSKNIFGKSAAFGTTASTFGFGSNTLSSTSPFPKPNGTPTTQPLLRTGTQQTLTFAGGMFSQQQSPNLFGRPHRAAAFGARTPSFQFSSPPASQKTMPFYPPKPRTTFPVFGQATTTGAPIFRQQQHQQPAFKPPAQPAFKPPVQQAFKPRAQPTFNAWMFAKTTTTGFGRPMQPALCTGLTSGRSGFFPTNTMQPQANIMAQQPQPLPLPWHNSYKQPDDYKMALNISDQFGQLSQLSGLKGDYAFKKCEAPVAIKQDDIQRLLVRPIGPPSAKAVKRKMVIAT